MSGREKIKVDKVIQAFAQEDNWQIMWNDLSYVWEDRTRWESG